MDAAGKIFAGIAIAAIMGAVVGFYFLSKKGPRGAVLIAAAILFFCGTLILANTVRELHLLEGVLRLSGVIGGVLGIIDLVRKRPTATATDDPKG